MNMADPCAFSKTRAFFMYWAAPAVRYSQMVLLCVFPRIGRTTTLSPCSTSEGVNMIGHEA